MKHPFDTHLIGTIALLVGGACLVPSAGRAQQVDPRHAASEPTRHDAKSADIPSGSRPPKGMCRIWLADVPASQQPAATDCAAAVRNRPQNGRVIFGDDYARAKRDSTTSAVPGAKGFLQMKPPTVFRKHPV